MLTGHCNDQLSRKKSEFLSWTISKAWTPALRLRIGCHVPLWIRN